MVATKRKSQLIAEAVSAFTQRHAFQNSLQRSVAKYNARNRSIGQKFRQKLLNKTFASAGIDLTTIGERQSKNDAADRKFSRSLVAKINKNSKAISARHIAVMKLHRKRLNPHILPPPGPGPGPGPAPLFDLLTVADSISFDVDPVDPGITTNSSIAPWNNLAKINTNGTLDRNPFSAYISFVWTAPRDGTLNAVAFVNINGSNSWSTQHGCLESSVDQSGSVFLSMHLEGQEPNPLDCDQQAFFSFFWDHTPGCSGDAGENIIDAMLQLKHPDGFPVTAGQRIVMMVVPQIVFEGVNVTGSIDLSSAAKCINVPAIALNLS